LAEDTAWQKIARRIRVPSGFVFAAVFLWLARPSWPTLTASLVLVAPGLWLRAYASGYVRKNAELTTTGPYAHTRNPLYLGSMLIAFGFAAAAASWMLLAALALLFAAIYIPTIHSEEAYLRERFAAFDAYANAVPRLLPRLRAGPRPSPQSTPQSGPRPAQPSPPSTQPADAGPGTFSPALYRKHREYNSLIGVCAIYLALALRLVLERHLSATGSRPPWRF
jgi:protein-S-isoprenylcysteine O-methyltransferase Ste14